MRKFLLYFIIFGQLLLADDVTLWISSADDNGVAVSMVAEEEIFGFQMTFGVEDGLEDIFAPVDSVFYNEAGDSVSSTVVYPLSGAVLDFGYTCFINAEGLVVAFSLTILGLPLGIRSF